MLNLDNFPEIENINNLVIREEHFNSSLYESVKSAFLTGTLENPYAASKKIKSYASELKHHNEIKSVESLANTLGKNKTSLDKLVTFLGSTQKIGEYFDTSKIETRNARELFQYSMENKTLPLVCLEHTLLVLAIGNSMGLNVGASMVPTYKRETNGTMIGNSEDHREHIVPMIYVKKYNEKYAALALDIVSKNSDLFQVYPDSFPVDSHVVVLGYLNNFSNSLSKRISILHQRRQVLEGLLSQNLEFDDLLLRNKAVKLYYTNDYKAALPLFEQLEKQHEKLHGNSINSHGEAKLYLAKCLYNLDKFVEAEAKFSEFFPDKEHNLWKLKNPEDRYVHGERFEEYRGVKDHIDVARGMILWAVSIQNIIQSDNRELFESDQDRLYLLHNSAFDMGFHNYYADKTLLNLDYQRVLKDKSKHKDLYWHFIDIGRRLFKDYVAYSRDGDKGRTDECQYELKSFLYNMINFYVSSGKASQDDSYLRDNLSIIVTDSRLRTLVEQNERINKVVSNNLKNKLMLENPVGKTFEINAVYNNIPYTLDEGNLRKLWHNNY